MSIISIMLNSHLLLSKIYWYIVNVIFTYFVTPAKVFKICSLLALGCSTFAYFDNFLVLISIKHKFIGDFKADETLFLL